MKKYNLVKVKNDFVLFFYVREFNIWEEVERYTGKTTIKEIQDRVKKYNKNGEIIKLTFEF